ncbi:MAG TPA: hypothetical protein PL072_05420 [Phycisphaerales bacterium]|nr:hypothetical protein [Phycisphaerales bacterium]
MSHIESWGETWSHDSFAYIDWTMKRWTREFSIGRAVLDSTRNKGTYRLRLNGVRVGEDFQAANPYALWSTVSRRISDLLQAQHDRITTELKELEKR